MIYVMFVLIKIGGYSSAVTFQYEFKDKNQCENALVVMRNRFTGDIVEVNSDIKVTRLGNFFGYCQEVRK